MRAAIRPGAPWRPGIPHFADVVASIEVVGGVVDIGGGLYQRSHPAGADERWFATPLAPDRIVASVAGCPLDLLDGSVDVRVCADTVLGVSAVRMAAGQRFGYRLDEAAHWLHVACLIEDLIVSAMRGESPQA